MRNLVSSVPFGSLTDESYQPTPIWLNWFNSVWRLLGLAPTIYTGILPPAFVPKKIGDTFIDTVAKKVYVSCGDTLISDWIILN